ncbi:DUF45 domain-containing protein, partial [Francisella tularensis subsp. holarctica]
PLTHPIHSKEFYAYVACYMPDWNFSEQRLN